MFVFLKLKDKDKQRRSCCACNNSSSACVDFCVPSFQRYDSCLFLLPSFLPSFPSNCWYKSASLNETPVDLADGHAKRYCREEVMAHLSLGSKVDFVGVLATSSSSTLRTIARARICKHQLASLFPLHPHFLSSSRGTSSNSPLDLLPQAQASPEEGFVFS